MTTSLLAIMSIVTFLTIAFAVVLLVVVHRLKKKMFGHLDALAAHFGVQAEKQGFCASFEGVPFRVDCSRMSKNPYFIAFSMPCPVQGALSIRKCALGDGMAYSLGLTQRAASGDENFDWSFSWKPRIRPRRPYSCPIPGKEACRKIGIRRPRDSWASG